MDGSRARGKARTVEAIAVAQKRDDSSSLEDWSSRLRRRGQVQDMFGSRVSKIS